MCRRFERAVCSPGRVGLYAMADTRIRPATGADSDAVISFLQAGFRAFGDFAPGWQAPEPSASERLANEWVLDHPDTWVVVAEDASGVAGQCGFHPGHTERLMRGERIAGLAHLWQLFVRRDQWGSGLAGQLHDMALAEMHARGYARTRLFTPEVQVRARRFYEKRGWELSGRSIGGFGEPPLELVEYEREV